jgi:hypothetical protein
MDTAPIDSYENAADIFTFGADSFGMWLFVILAMVLFAGMIVRMVQSEAHSFAEMKSEGGGSLRD